jgi:putative hydrolase of the HAD superfamily
VPFRIVIAVATPRAVIFDLGGTLVHWPDWENGADGKWAASYDHLVTQFADRRWPSRDAYVMAMRESEREHWRRVDTEHWSGPPTGLVREGFDRLGVPVSGAELLGAMDGYARAIAGWSTVDPDAIPTITLLRERGYRLGVLSNTWWAADWHNADLATHGLASLIDAIVYTSDLPYSKPHRTVFQEVAKRLDVMPAECVMIGDRMVDDVSGALEVGMRGVWRRNESGFPSSIAVPTAEVTRLAELPELLRKWGGA